MGLYLKRQCLHCICSTYKNAQHNINVLQVLWLNLRIMLHNVEWKNACMLRWRGGWSDRERDTYTLYLHNQACVNINGLTYKKHTKRKDSYKLTAVFLIFSFPVIWKCLSGSIFPLSSTSQLWPIKSRSQELRSSAEHITRPGGAPTDTSRTYIYASLLPCIGSAHVCGLMYQFMGMQAASKGFMHELKK